MTPTKKRAWISAGLLIAIIGTLAFFVLRSPLRDVITSPERIREHVESAGIRAPLIMVGLQTLQIVVALIPGQAADIANGYLFGWWGSIPSLIGTALGSSLAILLARRFGRPLVEVFITPKGMSIIRPYTRRRSYWPFFILFLLPGTPDDLLSFAIGLTSIPIGRSLLITMLGRIPGMMAAVAIGATGQDISLLTFSLLTAGVAVAFGLVLWLWPGARRLTKLTPSLS